jgi:hypothetical protein
MAYFSNGCEGEDYAQRYCRRCVHSKLEEAPGVHCPVMDAHWLWAYELANEHETHGKKILDMLIPMNERNYPARCAMFHEKRGSKS